MALSKKKKEKKAEGKKQSHQGTREREARPEVHNCTRLFTLLKKRNKRKNSAEGSKDRRDRDVGLSYFKIKQKIGEGREPRV